MKGLRPGYVDPPVSPEPSKADPLKAAPWGLTGPRISSDWRGMGMGPGRPGWKQRFSQEADGMQLKWYQKRPLPGLEAVLCDSTSTRRTEQGVTCRPLCPPDADTQPRRLL